MKHKKQGNTFPRVSTRLPYIFFGSVAMFMLCAAIDGISGHFTTWKLPVWEMELGGAVFVTVFMLAWFGFVASFARLLFLGLETVSITPEEVCIKIGPAVVRRMSRTEIKTIVRTGDEYPPYPVSPLGFSTAGGSYSKYSTWRLVLSPIPAEELREMSLSVRQKNLKKKQLERMANRDEPKKRIKQYMKRNIMKNRFWVEYSSELEEALRKYLTTTVFIV